MADATPSSSEDDRRDAPAPPRLSGRAPRPPLPPTGPFDRPDDPFAALPGYGLDPYGQPASPMSGGIGPLDSASLAALETGPTPVRTGGLPAYRTGELQAYGDPTPTPDLGTVGHGPPSGPPSSPLPGRPRSRREAREAERHAGDGPGTGPFPVTDDPFPAPGGAVAGPVTGPVPGPGARGGGPRPHAVPSRPAGGPSLVSRRRTLIAAGAAAGLGAGVAALVHERFAAAKALDRSMSAAPPDLSARAFTGASRSGTRTAKGPALEPTSTGLLALPSDLDVEHTLRRFTYGATPTLRAEIEKVGVASWLGAQLDPRTVEDPGGDAVARAFPRLRWSVAETVEQIEYEDQWAVMMDLSAAHLGRAIWSKRQLLEVMVDFWSNHLNVTNPSDGVWMSRHRFDADVIRAHALGRFEDMLVASAFHPAMLAYLDAYNSTGDAPNENYARELLELHTVGVDGGYTERDIKQAALLITGWTLDEGKVGYDPARHHAGRVKVMGWSHANATRSGGKKAVTSLLRYLARHPSTARYLARKLAVRFVSDSPSPELVERLATVYLQQRTAIRPVLVALMASPEFAASDGRKKRRPMEATIAAARALGVRMGEGPKGLLDLYHMLDGLGHKPLAWPMPNGYPDVAAKWQSPAAALNQVNVMTAMVHGWWPKALGLPAIGEVFPNAPTSRHGAVDAVARRFFGRAANAREVEAFDRLLGAQGKLGRSFGRGTWEQTETLALAATLLLNSPAHLAR